VPTVTRNVDITLCTPELDCHLSQELRSCIFLDKSACYFLTCKVIEHMGTVPAARTALPGGVVTAANVGRLRATESWQTLARVRGRQSAQDAWVPESPPRAALREWHANCLVHCVKT
jgi:hypothetical protein